MRYKNKDTLRCRHPPADLASDPTAPFCFLMDASMLGVGVGFDTKGAGTIDVVAPGSAEDREVGV